MNNNMAINTYITTTKSKKQSKQEEQRQSNGNGEYLDGHQMGGEFGGKWVKR